jgi:hypothetical protein
LGLKLGKKPARPGAVKLALKSYLIKPELPKPPDVFSYAKYLSKDIGLLANDRFGCCVWAGADHETMIWNKYAGIDVLFRDEDCLSDYTAVTGFDPSNPSSDGGTDMQEAASYRRRTGIVDSKGCRHKIGGYASVTAGSIYEHKLATWMFGAVGVGLVLGDPQLDQFERKEPWNGSVGDYPGGHYVPIVGADGEYLYCVTWGRVHPITYEFFKAHNDESIVYLSEEAILEGNGPSGLALDQLRADLQSVVGSGRP